MNTINKVLFIDAEDVREFNAAVKDSSTVSEDKVMTWYATPVCNDGSSIILELTARFMKDGITMAKLEAYSKSKGVESKVYLAPSFARLVLAGKWHLETIDGIEINLDVIPISPEKVLTSLKSLVEDVRETWSGAYSDVMAASQLNADELKALGYDVDASSGKDA